MAHPERVDPAVPRAKAALHFLFAALAFGLGYPAGAYLLALTGLAMAASAVAGPKFSPFGLLFKVLRPALRIPPGKPELLAPHRFAEGIGAGCLLLASGLIFAGATLAGQILTLLVAALALLNAVAGICVGCQMYLLLRRSQARPAG